MQIIPLDIPDVKLIIPKKFGDDRGFFSETYSDAVFSRQGINVPFVQDNHSFSAKKGVLRGLHYQTPPFAQDKLVRVLRGAILDVAVDLRKKSPTFGQHVCAELSAENWAQIFVPLGFAHGFVTLEDNTEIAYKVSNIYAPDHDTGIAWDDPELNIEWPVTALDVQLSAKDKILPRFSAMKNNNPF